MDSFVVCDETIMDGCFLSYICMLNLNKMQRDLAWSTFFIKKSKFDLQSLF